VRSDERSVADRQLSVAVAHQDRERLDRHTIAEPDCRRLNDDSAGMDLGALTAGGEPLQK
jgi:hypothetical protein